MSSILKALRKLEEEKARRQQGSPDIARDILCGNFQRRRSAGWTVFCGAFLAVMAVGALAFWLTTSRVQKRVPADPATGNQPAPAVARVQPSAEPQPASQPRVKKVARESIEHGNDKVPTDSTPAGRPARVVSSPEPAAPAPAPVPAPQSVNHPPPEPAAPQLRLSGVAYQSDPDARMAIINELPVMKGTVIDGARVEEILRDRVYLSFQDRRLEVRLDPNPSGE